MSETRRVFRGIGGARHLAAAAASLLAIGGVVWGCSGQAAAVDLATSGATRASASTADATQAAAATTAFGLDLLRTGTYAGGNVVLSPASIAFALAMARAGAAGETAAQMDAVMHSAAGSGAGNGLNSLSQALAGLSGTVTVDGRDQQLTLRIANAPFAQRGLQLEPAYLDTLATNFGAGLRLVDFDGDSSGAIRTINGWVSDQTENRIPSLLNTLPLGTQLVLVNAIYLKAPWQTQFEPGATSSQPFTRLDGSQVAVPTMSSEIECSYAQGPGWQAADVPYAGGSLVMTIIVPDDLAGFEGELTAARLDAITAAMQPARLDLALPRFKTETKSDLTSTLPAMGMPLAFDPINADFSGITRQERLFIALVVHQATISVDETGTEATAATAVVMAAASGAPSGASFHVNRPFLFAIRDTTTGAILFLGRIVDPVA
ncbi:MAG: serpin family protein [Candidatus Limnocylindrales bacterium]